MAGPEQDKQDTTDFGTSLATLCVGLFFVFCAFYLGPYPDLAAGRYTVPVGAVVWWGCLVMAAVCFVFFAGFWGVAMSNSPEMGRFFKEIWGGGEQGWQYLSQTALLVVAGFAVHLVYALLMFLVGAADWLGWLRYVAWVVQFPVLAFALMAAVSFANACDAFFVRPILESTATGGEKYAALIDAVRKRGVVVIPILIALIALYVEIF